MIALGIDPGTRRVGYGVIRRDGNEFVFIAAGILKIKSGDNASALVETKRELGKLIAKHKPDAVGIEKLFFAKNQKTGIAVAEARGVILVTAAECGVPIREYTPNEVKLGVTGYGMADKKAVFKMVALTLKKPGLKIIDDASDALALAIMASGAY